ncbi:MAG: dihydroorotate dehydrogenase [Phycisphaerae bacterium]|nr:dihydroorotate dehydrogenase [Phycisphaerae bacterium]MDP7637291.1 dihydroorotate dehydrogenase [Phycisphaerae bacterium]
MQKNGTTNEINLHVDIAGVTLANPLMTASGTCGYADEYADFVDLSQLGAFVTKSITAASRQGHPYRRVAETRAGMLNAIGLANVGLEAFLAEKVPLLKKLQLPVFVNVAGATVDEYVAVAAALEGVDPIRGVELNISCPNVKAGGIQFGTDPAWVSAITAELRRVCRKNILIVKLSPNVTDITATAAAAVDAGADALSMINTFTAMAIDVEERRPVLANVTGGLSGPAIRPIAVYMVHRVYTQVARPAGVPIIGMGGIQHAHDAIEFLIAGATGLAVGTALFVDPACLLSIRRGIEDYLRRHSYHDISEIIGTLKTDPD